LRELARGEAERKLVHRWKLRSASKTKSNWNIPMELLEPLAFCWRGWWRMTNYALATRALATDEVRLRLRWKIARPRLTVRLPVPSLDTKAFLKLLQLDLEADPPPAPIVHLWME
jgi:protein ImuB